MADAGITSDEPGLSDVLSSRGTCRWGSSDSLACCEARLQVGNGTWPPRLLSAGAGCAAASASAAAASASTTHGSSLGSGGADFFFFLLSSPMSRAARPTGGSLAESGGADGASLSRMGTKVSPKPRK